MQIHNNAKIGLRYYTIEREDTAQDVAQALMNDFQGLEHLFVQGAPLELNGSARILVLNTGNGRMTVKVDGPGIVIDQLYRIINKTQAYNSKYTQRGKAMKKLYGNYGMDEIEEHT